jgi:hypothetical protein
VKLSKLLLVVGIVFVGYWMLTSPGELARVLEDGVAAVWDLAAALFNGIIDFLDALQS